MDGWMEYCTFEDGTALWSAYHEIVLNAIYYLNYDLTAEMLMGMKVFYKIQIVPSTELNYEHLQ